ncbi:MAG: outer membrane beta-barrel protein [Rhodocyclaceae bacterium]|nr:outer membrane beta-barrel protein [Rhodocyclaceae bacterium]
MTVVAAALLAAASSASAFWDDRLQVSVGETVTSDSNVFRLSGNDPTPDKGDTFHATTLGINLDTPVSRQRFQAGADWSQVRYNRFSGLNHLDRNERLNWLWQGGDQWNGHLGYTETDTLASFNNFVGVGLTTANPLKTKQLSGTAVYRLASNWELQAGLADLTQRNGLALRQIDDVDVRSANLGFAYISTANNRLGAEYRQDDGHYPNLEPVGAALIDNDYVQRSVGATVDWTLTGKSHFAGRIDRVRRDFDQQPQRDFSGTTYRAAYDWLATGKFTLGAVAQRDISTSEDVQTSIVRITGVSLTPSYAVTEKVHLSASVDSNVRDYLGDLGGFAGRVDHVHSFSTSLSYQPLRSLFLLLTGLHETRSSNIPLADYSANVVSINARFTF